MVIGIIGASISGLIAGKLLAQAGHEVTIYEKSEQFGGRLATRFFGENNEFSVDFGAPYLEVATPAFREDRKSTRLNSSHVAISYAVFCLKKKRTHACIPVSPPERW